MKRMKRIDWKTQEALISGFLLVFGTSLIQGCASASHRTTEAAPAQARNPTQSHVGMVKSFKPEGVENTAEYHFSLAQAYAQDGDPDHAIEEYKLALLYDSKSALIHARLATEYVKKGMLSAALEACKTALKLDPKFIDAHLMLAGLYSTNREVDLALREYNQVLKIDPSHEEAVVYRSVVLTEDGKGKAAVQGLEAFLKKYPDSPLVWYHLGRIEQQLDHLVPSAKAFRKAMEIRPGFTQAALALGFLYEEHQKNSEAIKVYQALYEDSQDVGAANRLATIYLKEEKYELALKYLETVTFEDPEDMNARVKLGLVQMQLKRFDKAIVTFESILTKYPDSDRVLYYLGSVYEELKDFKNAIEQLKKIKPDSKLYSDAVLHTAHLLKKTDQIDEVRRYVDDLIRVNTRIPGLYVVKASLEEEAKNTPKAIVVLEDAVEIFPDDEKIRYYLGSLYDREGQIAKGLKQMEEILKINPDNVDALNYIGYTWTTQGIRLDDAEKLLKRALVLRPDNAYIQDSWGWYLFTRGRTQEAIVQLEKAARLKPTEPTILEHLGDAYLKYNLREKARLQYVEAAKVVEEQDARRKLEGKLRNLYQELGLGEPEMPTRTRVPASGPSSTPIDY